MYSLLKKPAQTFGTFLRKMCTVQVHKILKVSAGLPVYAEFVLLYDSTELLQNVLQFKVKIQKSNGIEIFRWLPFLGFTYFSIIDGFHIFHVSYCKSC